VQKKTPESTTQPATREPSVNAHHLFSLAGATLKGKQSRAMFNTNLIYQARWDQLYNYFVAGSPPLVLKLLLINTIFLILFLVRNARNGNRPQSKATYMVQGLLIAANATVMFQNDMFGVFTSARNMINF
jgi:hypothetical protein